MRVLQVCHHFHPCIGGIERHVEDLCLHLMADGHQADVLCLNTCHRGGELPPKEVHRGIKVRRVPYLNLGIYKVAPLVLCYTGDYDLIHVHGLGFFSDFLALTKPFHRKPLVLSTHGGIFHTPALGHLKRLYFQGLSRLTLRAFERIIAVSRGDMELFSQVARRVEHIPNGVTLEGLSPRGERDGRTFLYVGRLSRNKRVERLLETFSRLKVLVPDFKLYIVGGDFEGLLPGLRTRARELGLEGRAEFVGEKDREGLLGYYSRAGFIVSASEYEGFGISILEGMAMGLVPILSDIRAHRDLVEGGGGFLLDYSDPEGAAGAIASIVGQDLEGVRARARARAEECDWRKIVKRVENIYQGALSKGEG